MREKRTYREEQKEYMRFKGYWAVPDMADIIGVSASTVYRWTYRSMVHHKSLGQGCYVSIHSIIAHLNDPQRVLDRGLDRLLVKYKLTGWKLCPRCNTYQNPKKDPCPGCVALAAHKPTQDQAEA